MCVCVCLWVFKTKKKIQKTKVLIEYCSNLNGCMGNDPSLDSITVFTMLSWFGLIRFIFLFIFVDENGHRLGLLFRKTNQCCKGLALLISQLFFHIMPLLPTAGVTVTLYKRHALAYAHWNQLCIGFYLVLTYLPMLYLLIGNTITFIFFFFFYFFFSIDLLIVCVV